MFQIVGMLKVDANPCQGFLQEVAQAIVRGNLYLDSLYKELLPATPHTSQFKTRHNASKSHDQEETESKFQDSTLSSQLSNSLYSLAEGNGRTCPEHITHRVFREGTSQSMESPRMKKPVPLHQAHSWLPLASHDVHFIGRGCWFTWKR